METQGKYPEQGYTDRGQLMRRLILAAQWIWSVYALLIYAAAIKGQPSIAMGVACLVIGSFLATIGHEAGHAVVAAACGWRVLTFAVRPFALQFQPPRLAWMPRGHESGIAGFVAAIPTTADRATSTRWACYVAAGPSASMILAIVAFATASLILPHFDTETLRVSHLAFGLSLQALAQCCFSLLPAARAATKTDGAKLWALQKSRTPPSALVWLATARRYKLRLCHVPAWIVAQARENASEPIRHDLDAFEVAMLLDARDGAAARVKLSSYLDRHGTNEWAAYCDVFLTAMMEGDAEGAAAKYWTGPKVPELAALSHAAQAAIDARAGRRRAARAQLKAMHRALRADSSLRDPTYAAIAKDVEALLAQ